MHAFNSDKAMIEYISESMSSASHTSYWLTACSAICSS